MTNNWIFLDEIVAYGHANVLGTHSSTLEITKETFLTPTGNCIIGVNADKSVNELNTTLKNLIKEGKQINIKLIAGEFEDSLIGFGHSDLDVSNPTSIVLRTSNFISDRTGLITCSKGSCDINRELIEYLKNPDHKVVMQFFIEPNPTNVIDDKSIQIIKCPKKHGNILIQELNKSDLISSSYKITQEDEFLFIPINLISIDNPIYTFAENNQNLNITIFSHEDSEKLKEKLPKREIKNKSLKSALVDKIPTEIQDLIPSSFDIIGDIAIIELNREDLLPLKPFITMIGETLLETFPSIQSVYQKGGNVEGDFRTRSLDLIAGAKRTQTLYKENKCRFYVDVEKTFFTPRLSFERDRVTNSYIEYNKEGYVWDMFCGIGPFLIQIAKTYKKGHYVGTDINPNAIELAKKNIKLSKLEATDIKFENIDVSEFLKKSKKAKQMKHNVSRIIMNLPERNLEFIKYIPPFISESGTLLQIYQFNENKNPREDALSKLTEKLEESKLKLTKILNFRIVKPYNPALDTTVLDVLIHNQ